MVADQQAPIPYVRQEDKRTYKPDTVKVIHEFAGGRERKLTLKIYKGSTDEDVESFFEVFEHFLYEMGKIGLTTRMDLNTDCAVLFQHFKDCLGGNALTDWNGVIGGPTPRRNTWRDFKYYVSRYIVEKVLDDEEAYSKQKDYLENRSKPISLSMKEWDKRLTTICRYHKYMLTRQQMERQTDGRYRDFHDLWDHGELSEADKISILRNRSPASWKLKFEERGLHRRTDLAYREAVQALQDIEAAEIQTRRLRQMEQAHRAPARRAGGARIPYRYSGRGGPQQYYYSRGGFQQYNQYPSREGNQSSYSRGCAMYHQQQGRGGINYQQQGPQQPYQRYQSPQGQPFGTRPTGFSHGGGYRRHQPNPARGTPRTDQAHSMEEQHPQQVQQQPSPDEQFQPAEAQYADENVQGQSQQEQDQMEELAQAFQEDLWLAGDEPDNFWQEDEYYYDDESYYPDGGAPAWYG